MSMIYLQQSVVRDLGIERATARVLFNLVLLNRYRIVILVCPLSVYFLLLVGDFPAPLPFPSVLAASCKLQ